MESQSGAFYSSPPGITKVIPFRPAVIPWAQRSDQFRRAAEIAVANTGVHKPWEAVFFLLHRATEYILKAALLHDNPDYGVRKHGHDLSELFDACAEVFECFPRLNDDQVDRLMHFEKERYPDGGWNYFVTTSHVQGVVELITAVRDLLGGKGFTFPASC